MIQPEPDLTRSDPLTPLLLSEAEQDFNIEEWTYGFILLKY
jgi:hypothetical protein